MLAKPEDLRTAMGWSGSSHDAEIERLLAAASALGSHLAGVELERVVARIEYPELTDAYETDLRLSRYPVEAITAVKVADVASTASGFDALDPLTAEEDYHLLRPETAHLQRLGAYWPAGPRRIEVTYTAGLLDARGIVGALVGSHAAGENTLDLDTAVAAGDTIVVAPATASEQLHTVASVSGSDPWIATVTPDLVANYDDAEIARVYPAAAQQPSGHLQQAVIQQAIWWWNTRDKAGIRELDLGDRGGSFSAREAQMHPAMNAFRALGRFT